MPEWVDEKYVCDNCGEDGKGEYIDIRMRGWPPMCLCKECAEGMTVYNEE